MRTLIVSPSGNFYGSEQVLFDYLETMEARCDVAVNAHGIMAKKLREQQRHHIIDLPPGGLYGFYAKCAWWLLTGRYDAVYWNEAGHSRYALLLARWLKKKRFVIHVRINEDALPGRWKTVPGSNVTVLTISDYLKNQIPVPSAKVFDPYRFSGRQHPARKPFDKPVSVAIIGRITRSKGIALLPQLLAKLSTMNRGSDFVFRLYGNVSADVAETNLLNELTSATQVEFKGFVENNSSIYQESDLVLHLNGKEPLGRIFFEALEYQLSFIGINAGGIGEIGGAIGYTDMLATPGDDVAGDLARLLVKAVEEPSVVLAAMAAARQAAEVPFSVKTYTNTINQYLAF